MGTKFFARCVVAAVFAVLVASVAPALAQGTGALHGRIIDAAGNPVADAVLTFNYIGDYNITLTAKSDAKGNWGRGGLAPGSWTVVIAKGDLSAKLNRIQVALGGNTPVPDITIVAAGAGAAPAAPQAAGPQTATSQESAVFATAVDSKGAAIKDLALADWTVKEDGATRQLSDAKLATEPMQIVVLIENSRYILQQLKDISAGLTAFVDAITAGSPESQITLMGVSGQVTTLIDSSKSATDLNAVISHLTPGVTGDDAILEGLTESSKKLARATTRRRVIVLFNYEGTPESSQMNPQNVVATVMGSGASVWNVSYRSNSQTTSAGDRDVVAAALMPALGGDHSTISSSSAIGFQMKRIADLLLGQYMLLYKRPAGPSPKLLALAVSRSGSKIFAPKFPAGVTVARTSANAEEVAKHNKRQAELEGFFKAGTDAYDAGNYDEALAKFTAVAAENDKCAACYSKMGDAYVKKNDLDNAEKSYLKAIDVDPTQPDPYSALAGVYNTQKKFDDAAKMSAKGNELKGPVGGDANSVFNQGIILWNASKIPEAKVQFLKAVELDPKMADAHYWLAMSWVNEGKLPESKKDFEEYIKLAPTGQYVDTAKAILAQISSRMPGSHAAGDVAGNLEAVRRRIDAAAQRAHRAPSDVHLIAVSKTFDADAVRAAAAAGQQSFGENRVQEGLDKIDELTSLALEWHLIGHLQSNKARKAAAAFAWIHAIDSLDLLRKVDAAAAESGARPRILVQVDLAHEATKHGAEAGAAAAIVRAALDAASCDLRGLMIVPPIPADPEESRPWFRQLRELRDAMVAAGVPADRLRELSMGMSHDFEVAIDEGATMVRVGTAIFGRRTPQA